MALLYCLYCFVLVPLSIRFANDVVYADTALPTVIEIIYDTVEVLAISLSYAVLIYSVYRYGLSGSVASMIVFCVITLFKYFANLSMDWINYGFDVSELAGDLFVILLPFLLEILQYFAVVLISHKIISSYVTAKEKRNLQLIENGKEELSENFGVYPFSGVVNMKNPIMKVAFWSGVVIAVTSTLQSVPFYFMVTYLAGFPLFSVLSQIITSAIEGVVCYFAVILLEMMFFEQRTKHDLYGV